MMSLSFFFFYVPTAPEIYTYLTLLSLHDALPVCDEGLLRQLHALDQQGAGVGDHAVEVAAAQLVPLRGGASDAAAVARCARGEFGAGQHHRRGTGAER